VIALPNRGVVGLRLSIRRNVPAESHAGGKCAALRAALPMVIVPSSARDRHDAGIAGGNVVAEGAAVGVVGTVLATWQSLV